MRKLIHSVLGTIAAIALVGGVACSRSRDANTPSTQTEAPAAERVNPGSGYFGSAPENTNRQSTPNAIGGGPASGADSSGSSMGIEQGTGTSGTGATGTDMSMSGGGDAGPKAMPKSDTNGGSPGMEKGDGSEKGSGSTGGTTK
jgi:hypothetical protein